MDKYTKIKNINIEVVKDDFDRSKKVDPNENWFEKFNKIRPVQSRSWEIQDPGDYQQHQTEVALEGLPFGNYWVFVC